MNDLEIYIKNYKNDVRAEIMRGAQQALPFLEAMYAISEEKRLTALAQDNYKAQLKIQTDHQIESMPLIQAVQDQTTIDSYGLLKGHLDDVAKDSARRNVTAEMYGYDTPGYQDHLNKMAENQGTRQANQQIAELNTLVNGDYYNQKNKITADANHYSQMRQANTDMAVLQRKQDNGYFDLKNQITGESLVSQNNYQILIETENQDLMKQQEHNTAMANYISDMDFILNSKMKRVEKDGKSTYSIIHNDVEFPQNSDIFSRYEKALINIGKSKHLNKEVYAQYFISNFERFSDEKSSIKKKNGIYYREETNEKGKKEDVLLDANYVNFVNEMSNMRDFATQFDIYKSTKIQVPGLGIGTRKDILDLLKEKKVIANGLPIEAIPPIERYKILERFINNPILHEGKDGKLYLVDNL